ncbi:unnamed protein product [Rotaria magnacalcarata]|uniref:F-box domain-containing protein n=2 Tax=Rotaria magnacalcarata TaxID=392030 RepID=A0A819QX16_9BILA|nr:unnamed protein product [Rotaria magnacalcarata]
MTSTRLEDLPHELFFIIFTYFNGVDLCLAFSNLNTRIDRLLFNVASHQSLDLTSGSVSYNAFRAYITDRYGVRSSFISSLKFDCLSLSPFGINDLFSSLMDTSIDNRLQRLTLITSEYVSVKTTEIIKFLEHMMIANKQGRGRLEHLTLTFENCNDYYAKIVTMIIQLNISFGTMILNVTKYIFKSPLNTKMYISPNETNMHIAIDSRPSLVNTVRLTLSLQYCSDLVLLLQRGVLPLIQQLNVTFERRNPHVDSRPVRFKVDEKNLLTTDTARLRKLSLRNLPMHYALQFVRFLYLTQLESLHLVDIFDNEIRCLAEFERAISIRLYNLVNLQFVLHFQFDTVLQNNEWSMWQGLDLLKNDLWQSRGWFVNDYIDTDEKRFIVYTVPYALSYVRSLRNHTFIAAQQPNSVDLKTDQLLLWTCTDSNPSEVAQSLKGLSQARHLRWNFEAMVSPLVLSSSSNIDSAMRWPEMQLRSLCLLMNSQIHIEDRANIITQMLLICPRLRTLAVLSKELALCLKQKPALTHLSLDHLHLYLDMVQDMVDPVALAVIFPNISYFSTGKWYLKMDINLAHVVLDLIKVLPYLRRLRFNDCNFFYEGNIDQSADYIVEMIQNSEQLRSKDSFVRVYEWRHMVIWI